MNWLRSYRIRLYIRNSMWVVPALSIVAGLIVVRFLTWLERALGWRPTIDVDVARIVIVTVAASLLSLVVVVASAMLVAVQLASAQLTPRVIALIYRNTKRKLIVSLFVFTFTVSVAVLVRIQTSVPLLASLLSAYGFLVSLGFFLYFIDDMGKSLRPSAALRTVGLHGREIIKTVYPLPLELRHAAPPDPSEILSGTPQRIVSNSADGAVLAFDSKGLVSIAGRANCLIELIPQVGDFVANGDPLFRLFQGGEGIKDEELRNSVAVGQERTMQQDPMFAFRIIVDIAIKGLSPAINDPTTAVLAIDQIHHLLRTVGARYLGEGR